MPLKVSQVREALQNEFGGLIDMSDLHGPPETLTRAFLSRALAALVTRKLLGCDHRTAADAVVDGRDDHGIDAIAVAETGTRIWLIQSKWSDQGTARFGADDALMIGAGLKLLDEQHFDRFNLKLQKHAELTGAAWGNPALRVTMVVAVMGGGPSPDVVRRLDDLAQEWNGHSKFLDYQVFDAKRIWQIVQDDLAAELAPAARFLAGVQSDSPSGADRLGIRDDVRTLAELIMARETNPPLAIAIIGDWGVGKSSLMVQVEAAVAELAASTRTVRENGQPTAGDGERSAFLETVRQVRFNAWHYSDEHLWHGLATKLFEELGTADGKDSWDIGGSPSAKTRAERKVLAADQERLEREVQALEAGPLAGTAPGLAAWLRHPVATGRLAAEVLRGGPNGPRAWTSVLLGAALTAILWALVAVLAYWGWQEFSVWLRSLVVAAAIAVPPGGWISYLRMSQRTFAARLKKGHDMVQSVHRQKQQELERVKKQRALYDAEARLSQFLADQAGGTGYAKYQGLLGQVRGDLETLSRALADARYQWEQDGGEKEPPLQRTILYIDDLDRCPPRRVVAVLEAVHLMLPLDLFIVIVSVDARWLIRSLDYHYRELFRAGNDHQAAAGPLSDDGGPAANGTAAAGNVVRQSAAAPQDDTGGPSGATPVEYLDKIFQIPFAVARPQPDAIADYLRSLLPDPAASPEADAPSESDGDRAGEMAVPTPGQSATGRQDARHGRENREGTPTAAAGASGAPSIEPYPEGLKLRPAEVQFMGTLWPLLPTPRAAKRLVNLYRLVRIGVPTAELDEFAGDVNGGPYQAVQVLLAILVGHPEFAERLFQAAMTGDPQGDLGQLAAHIKSQGNGSRSCEVVCDFLATFSGQEHAAVNLELARKWCPVLARFSFYTHDLAHSRAREFTV